MPNLRSAEAFIVFLKSNASLRNIDAKDPYTNIEPSKNSFKNMSLLKDLRFENHIDDRFMTTSTMRTEYLEAKEILEDLINAIKI